jgi:hypothetical protein
MSSARSWNRREFAVTQNGYFTILKSTGWFSAVPLPAGFRYFASKAKGASPALTPASASLLNAPGQADIQQSTIRLQTIDSSTSGRHLMRLALIVLAATALTWIGLWCTAHP